MIVNASQVTRWLAAQGSSDPWGEYDRATIAQLAEWAPLAREWERGRR